MPFLDDTISKSENVSVCCQALKFIHADNDINADNTDAQVVITIYVPQLFSSKTRRSKKLNNIMQRLLTLFCPFQEA